jgi:hypothetical protein
MEWEVKEHWGGSNTPVVKIGWGGLVVVRRAALSIGRMSEAFGGHVLEDGGRGQQPKIFGRQHQ